MPTGFPGVRGTIHSMLAADDKLFVVTREGEIYAFGGGRLVARANFGAVDPILAEIQAINGVKQAKGLRF